MRRVFTKVGLVAEHADKPLIVSTNGAVHVGSERPLPALLLAPANSSVISPLTHLLELGAIDLPELRKLLPNKFDPLNSNPYAEDSPFSNSTAIKSFLEDVTGRILALDRSVLSKEAMLARLRGDIDELANRYFPETPEPDEAATGLALDVVTSSLAETRDTGIRIKLADLVVTDPDRPADFRQHGFTLSNREMFEVEGGVLYLKAGAVLDHENATSHSVTVRLDGSDLSQEFTLTVENRLDEVLAVDEVTDLRVAENGTSLVGGTQLGVTTREAGDYRVEYRLKGGEAHPFVTVSPAGLVSLHTAPSHEATPALRFEVEARYRQAGQADDAGWGAAREISIAVGDVDEAATGLALDVVTSSLAETRDTGARIKLADLVVTDPDRNADFRQHALHAVESGDVRG